ncbi:putative threonylcarbamoyladenosine tRNA methylthiotransferase [Cocos nucifera]|uniref:Threonylcarbamoyladenosine tRNA methylthiotransferase n=1 Tax=Cocos nucifera TaxID=13894 RepID=A0A8K0I083_COCNU|nr:putative threonylcarbamoyladenosine tRNA methylthiotransferase [Cocos nucifera]
MEDIEDVVAAGAPPGLRLPLTAVGVKPRKKPRARLTRDPLSNPQIPGTQSDSEYMAGQLSAFGYAVTDEPEEADLWLINTCTVKSPSQSAMTTLISKCKSAKKPLVVAGCVPQGSRDLKELEGVSVIGVQQIDRVVEVVEETLKGHEVRILSRKTLPALDLPKVRKNRFIEILPINVGCLGACTYCKTKHARGHLGSYTVNSLVERVKIVVSEGVKEIWLSSEDTGAYGRDIGTNLPVLLNSIVAELPPDRSTMLRIGMTNPPFILEHLKEIANVLRHPCVYSFLHVPVQSGSDSVLAAMNREYTVSEFRTVADTLIEFVPGMQIATDIICGFPGTPAARMKKVPSVVVKKRSRELTNVFESFSPYKGMEGRVERIWITEIATDGIHLVGHTKGYIQVLIIARESMLGTSTDVKITSVGRWSVFGEVIQTPSAQVKENIQQGNITLEALPCPGSCNKEPEPCQCAVQNTGQQISDCGHYEAPVAVVINSSTTRIQVGRNFISSVQSMLLKKRRQQGLMRMNDVNANKFLENQERRRMSGCCHPDKGTVTVFLYFSADAIICNALLQVGHTKGYIQVLIIARESMLGTSTDVKITSVGRWSVFGEVIQTPSAQVKENIQQGNITLEALPCPGSCNKEPEPCQCAVQNTGQQISDCGHYEAPVAVVINSSTTRIQVGRNFISSVQSMLLKKRRQQGLMRMNDVNANKFLENQERRRMSGKLSTMDWILLSGMIVSFLTTIAVLILLSSRMLSS